MIKYSYFKNLITIIQANKEFFLETIVTNPNNLAYFISTDVPNILCKATNDQFETVPIKNITANLKQNSDCDIYFVEFADEFVTQDTDCFAIAISVDSQNNIRLFTYEKGTHFDGTPAYFVGEFEVSGGHINYGTTSEYRISLFCGKIVEQLNK